MARTVQNRTEPFLILVLKPSAITESILQKEKKLGGGGGGGGDRICHVTDTGEAREAGPVL